MILNIKPGIENEVIREVKESDMASFFGTEHMPVLATSRIVAFMEYVALSSVHGLLPEGYSTVSSEINLKHFKPVISGEKITCNSRLVKVEGRLLYFEISLRSISELIASSSHIRTIINEEVFRRFIR